MHIDFIFSPDLFHELDGVDIVHIAQLFHGFLEKNTVIDVFEVFNYILGQTVAVR